MDGIRSGQRVFPIGSKQMLALLQAMRPGLTTHGFPPRSRTGRARDVCRMALGHAAGNAVERAYQRAALLRLGGVLRQAARSRRGLWRKKTESLMVSIDCVDFLKY